MRSAFVFALAFGLSLGDLSPEKLLKTQIAPVFGASQRLQPVTEAPAAVTIVTADEIARYGYRTLADILGGARGLFVTNDRNYAYVGTRGFAQPGDYNTRILLLINGHRMNDNIYDLAAVGADFGLDPATFERVEIIRGPASSLWGANALLAIVNVIPRSGASIGRPSIMLETGSLGERSARFAAGTHKNGLDVAVFGGITGVDGVRRLYFPEFDTPDNNGGIAERADGEDIRQLFSRLAFRNLRITAAFGRREKHVPTASYGTLFNDTRLETIDTRSFVDAEYERKYGATRLNVRAYADRYDYEGTYPYAADTGDATEGSRRTKSCGSAMSATACARRSPHTPTVRPT
jgi:iron complex outermembrane receptor protein